MDKIADVSKHIGQSAGPTFAAYEPLLRANAANIRATKFETYKYGNHPRQTLDIYYPTLRRRPSIADVNEPVLIFLHGGGLVRGSKTLPDFADGLAHANIGHFFAEKAGYTTIIPDYRLISHGARFPSGGEDLQLVVDWVRETLTKKDGYSAIELFVVGNSAGGVHLSTYAFAPQFATSRDKVMTLAPDASVRLRGVVMLSVPFNFKKADPSRLEVMQSYFGEDLFPYSPHGLLKTAMLQDPDEVLPHARVLLLNGTLDPDDEILEPKQDFLNEWLDLDDESHQAVTVDMMEGHNHLSPPLSLGTGIEREEAWGYQVIEFLESVRA